MCLERAPGRSVDARSSQTVRGKIVTEESRVTAYVKYSHHRTVIAVDGSGAIIRLTQRHTSLWLIMCCQSASAERLEARTRTTNVGTLLDARERLGVS